MDNNFAGLALVATALFIGLFFLGLGIRGGLARAAAIQSGMTAAEYSDWMDAVK